MDLYQAVSECSSLAVAVTLFAKAVGEYNALSRVDLQLLALTHTLELAIHGDLHLRKSPAPPRAAAKHSPGQGQLPGWGSHGGEWTELDALNEEASSSQAPGEGEVSKISSSVLSLQLERGNAGKKWSMSVQGLSLFWPCLASCT